MKLALLQESYHAVMTERASTTRTVCY